MMKGLLQKSTLLGTLLLLLLIQACKPSWQKAIQRGELEQKNFSAVSSYDKVIDLLIVPVEIRGVTYRFLFDTGAITSISEEMQEIFNFKIVAKGSLRDSQNSSFGVNYVNVDEIKVAGIPFKNQMAFVGDFKKNPVIECLKIDGIIGSNLMQLCYWTIDQEKEEIRLFSKLNDSDIAEAKKVKFSVNQQYSIKLDLKIDKYTLKNYTLDYGSNGYLSTPVNTMLILEKDSLFDRFYSETGFKQSGLVGNRTKSDGYKGYLNSIQVGELELGPTELKSSSKKLFGNKILENYIVTLDWKSKIAYFKEVENPSPLEKNFGISLGQSEEEDLVVRMVINESPAYQAGIRPSMQVLNLNGMDFESEFNLCDYMYRRNESQDVLEIELLDSLGTRQQYSLERIP